MKLTKTLALTATLSVALLLTVLSGCTTKVPDPVPSNPEVITVPDSGPGSLISRDGDTLRFTAGGTPPKVSDIVVSVKDGGFLLKVDSVSTEADGTITVTTSQASIAEAVENGTFSFTNAPPGKTINPAKEFELLKIDESFGSQAPIYDQNGITVRIPSGSFLFDAKYYLDFTISNHSLSHFATSLGGNTELLLDVEITANAAVEFQHSFQLLDQPIHKYLYGVISGIPVVIEMTMNAEIGVTGNVGASGDYQTGLSASSNVRFGAKYNNGQWGMIKDQGFDFTDRGSDWCMSGNVYAKAYVKPWISVQLFTVVGPQFSIEPYLDFTGTLTGCHGSGATSYNWALGAGLAGQAKVRADILDLYVLESPEMELFNLHWDIANESCDAPNCNGGEGLRIIKQSESALSGVSSGLALSPNDSKLYIAYWEDANSSRVQEFSLPNLSLLQTFTYGNFHTHNDVVLSSDGSRIFTTNYYYNSISQIDLNNANTRTDLSTYNSWPGEIDITPDRSKVLVEVGRDGRNYDMNNDSLAIYDISSGAFSYLGSVTLDDEPRGKKIGVSADSRYAYVPTRPRKSSVPKLYEVSLFPPYEVTRVMELENSALTGVVCIGNRVFVADNDNARIWIVDRTSWTRQANDLDFNPGAIAQHPSGQYLFVAAQSEGGPVVAIDVNSMSVAARYDGLPSDIHDIEFNNDGSMMYMVRRSIEGAILVFSLSP